MTFRALALALAIFSCVLAGCVVDDARTETLREREREAPPELPTNPIASPIAQGTTSSVVAVTIESLGTVDYDGLSVPMVSPDGRFLAAQGSPPPPPASRLAIEASRRNPANVDERFDASVFITPLTPGVQGLRPSLEVFDVRGSILLGRDASEEGVLIESPRPDGSRWIGVARWPQDQMLGDASVRWIVRERAVAAHAVFAEGGAVLYSRRAIGADRFVLVLQDRDGAQRVLALPDASLVYPLLAPDLRHATCLAVGEDGAIALLLIDLATGAGNDLGRVVRRFDLASSGGMHGAAQIVAASQSAVHNLPTHDALNERRPAPTEPLLGPIFFHPAMDRCAAIDASRRSLVALAPNSVAAVDAGDGRAVCSTPDGLVLWTPGPQAGRGTITRVLSEDYLPRRTASASRPFVLLAPMRRTPTSLMVFGMAPTEPP